MDVEIDTNSGGKRDYFSCMGSEIFSYKNHCVILLRREVAYEI